MVRNYTLFHATIVFENQNNQVNVSIDTISTHVYNESFLSFDGTKLVTGWWHVPLYLVFSISEEKGFYIAPFYDRYAFGYIKRKYEDAGIDKKDKISNKEFKQFPLNKDKFGFDAGFITSNGFTVYLRYVYTPFFKTGKGPLLNEMAVGIGLPTYKLYQRNY